MRSPVRVGVRPLGWEEAKYKGFRAVLVLLGSPSVVIYCCRIAEDYLYFQRPSPFLPLR